MPAQALPGSPEPVLAIGTKPSWLTDYAYADSPADAQEALEYCLGAESTHDIGQLYADLLSDWMGAEVKYVESQEVESSVKFV